MDGQVRSTQNNSLQERLNSAFTIWLEWFEAKPPFGISVRHLETAVALVGMCGMAGPPMKPNAFDMGRKPDAPATNGNTEPMAALRLKVIDSTAAALAAVRQARAELTQAFEPDWVKLLAGWLSELECHARTAGGASDCFPPYENQAIRCVYVLYQVSQMIHELSLVDWSAECVEPAAINGEWSAPMSKAEMARRIGLKPRSFETFIRSHEIRRVSRQLWQIRLDGMDGRTRQKLESA